MKKRSVRTTKSAARRAADAQVAEFERRDLGKDIRSARTARLLRARSRPTSIVLDDDLVRRLRAKAAKRGLGYQTMLKMIVREHLDEY
jgi:predicted DNA binding CopG/RHH family protein